MRFALLLLVGACFPAWSQGVEPGEWELTTISTSRLLSTPQTVIFKRCVKKEDADHPERWMVREANRNTCTVTPGARSGDTVSWEFSCPKNNLRGTGTATSHRTTLQGEMRTSLEVQGQRLEISTRATGRRIGDCQT